MNMIARSANLTQRVLKSLGLAIVTGRFETGFPTEKDICDQMNVSRTVTREAVKMLTAKGLLSARPRQGTRIEPMDHWNLLDPDVLKWTLERDFSLSLLIEFTEMRLGVEPAAAALAARKATPQDKAAIHKAVERMKAAERGEDDALSSDIMFHLSVLNATGNPFYRQMREMIETALRISILKTNTLVGANFSETLDHSCVADAIINGRSEAAEVHMARLIRNALNLMMEAQHVEAVQPPQPVTT